MLDFIYNYLGVLYYLDETRFCLQELEVMTMENKEREAERKTLKSYWMEKKLKDDSGY